MSGENFYLFNKTSRLKRVKKNLGHAMTLAWAAFG